MGTVGKEDGGVGWERMGGDPVVEHSVSLDVSSNVFIIDNKLYFETVTECLKQVIKSRQKRRIPNT